MTLFLTIKGKLKTPSRGIISLTLTFGSLCPHATEGRINIRTSMKIRFFETCGHNKLCPYKDGVLFNTLIICLLKPSNGFADEPFYPADPYVKASR